MSQLIRPALVLLALFSVLTGLLYPAAVTGLAQALFPHQANGSLVFVNGQAAGSELIGQAFDDPRYFHGRPSATGPVPYNAAASSGSNLSPANPVFIAAVAGRLAALRAANPAGAGPIPLDLVTASGSGLDPHISPEAARYRARRVAAQRGLALDRVLQLVVEHTEGRQFGLLGEPRVNVLLLNIALDGIQ